VGGGPALVRKREQRYPDLGLHGGEKMRLRRKDRRVGEPRTGRSQSMGRRGKVVRWENWPVRTGKDLWGQRWVMKDEQKKKKKVQSIVQTDEKGGHQREKTIRTQD